MVTISIIGWYGTETIGDIAILDGIFYLLERKYEDIRINLGSLLPFHTERTLLENKKDWKKNHQKITIFVFDLRQKSVIRENMESSDYVVIGGGPLMDIRELYNLRYCFEIAAQNKIPRIVWGCGIGPVSETYYGVLYDILKMADVIWLRDKSSVDFLAQQWKINALFMGDPAIISALEYKKKHNPIEGQYIVVNLRDINPKEYGDEKIKSLSFYSDVLAYLSEWEKNVKLVPMHSFAVGGDDRLFLTKISMLHLSENIEVFHKPLNLYETYEIFSNAFACLGMRYHSVLLQTVLNGNNYILEYTNSSTGKIRGFIQEVNLSADRVWNMEDSFELSDLDILKSGRHEIYDFGKIEKEYLNEMNKWMN